MGLKFPTIPDALCRQLGYPTDVFFPAGDDYVKIALAKSVCLNCTSSEICLDIALASDEEGIWGGTTESERRTIKRRRVLRTYASRDRKQREQERPAYACSSSPSDTSASYNHTPLALSKHFAQQIEHRGFGTKISTPQSLGALSWGPNQKTLVERVLAEFQTFQKQLSQQPGYNPGPQLESGLELFPLAKVQSSLIQHQSEHSPSPSYAPDQHQKVTLDFSDLFVFN